MTFKNATNWFDEFQMKNCRETCGMDFKECPQKCLNLYETMNINHHLRPKIMIGISALARTDSSKLFNINPMTTVFTNKVIISSLYPTGYRFGISYTKHDKSGEPEKSAGEVRAAKLPVFQTYLETDLDRHALGQACFNVSRNVGAFVSAQWGSCRSTANAFLEWANDRSNVTLMALTGTEKRAKFVLDFVFRLNRSWTVGNRLALGGGYRDSCGFPSKIHNSCLPIFSDKVDYSCLLRYDHNESNTAVSASVDLALNMDLGFRKSINDELTVGVELSGNPRHRKAKTTLMYRFAVNNDIQCRGEIASNGMVIGNIFKKFSENVTMGFSALLDHRTDRFGLGFEFIMDSTTQKENHIL